MLHDIVKSVASFKTRKKSLARPKLENPHCRKILKALFQTEANDAKQKHMLSKRRTCFGKW